VKRLILIIGVVFLVGCAGPTKSGKIARANAHQRMDVVNADLAAQQSRQQFEVGQLKAALETIDAAIARYDNNAAYHLLRGRILIEQHRLDAASKSLTRSAELDPKVAEPYYFQGVLHQRWSEDEEALASYKKAMECNATHPQFLLAAAESHVALGQLDEAIELLELAGKEFQHQPSVAALLGYIYMRNGMPKEAAGYLAYSRLLGNEDEEVLMLLATAQFNAGEYTNCLFTLSQIKDHGDLSFSFQRLEGKCLSATGRHIQGRDICLKVTRQTPGDADAWVDLGFIAWDMGDYKRVAMCGKKISELAPDYAEGPLFEGIAALHEGDVNNGMKLLAQAQSDNTIDGIDSLLQCYGKSTKLRVETPIAPNMRANVVEGGLGHPVAQVEKNLPIVGVAQEYHLAP
jgi:tetratricopeptide (TPR) repeat protein